MKWLKKNWKTLFWVFLVVFIAMCIFYYFNLQALRQVNRLTAGSHLAQIRLGVYNYFYYAKNNSFPEFYSEDKQRETWSWRVVLASEFLSFQKSEQIQYQCHWNSGQNADIVKGLPKTFHSYFSSNKQDQEAGLSSYVAVKEKGTVWTETNLGHIYDPIKNHPDMIVIIELPQAKNFWAEPGDDITPDEVIRLFQEDGGLVKNSKQSIFSRDHWPKYFLTVEGAIGNFGEIKSIEELKRRLVIQEE